MLVHDRRGRQRRRELRRFIERRVEETTALAQSIESRVQLLQILAAQMIVFVQNLLERPAAAQQIDQELHTIERLATHYGR